MALRGPEDRPEASEFFIERGTRPPCGYILDTETGEICGQPITYEFKLSDYKDKRGGACTEHAEIVREWVDLDSMWEWEPVP